MSNILEALGALLGGIGAFIVFAAVVFLLGVLLGGAGGALTVLLYNALFGASFSVTKFALIGSIVGVVTVPITTSE